LVPGRPELVGENYREVDAEIEQTAGVDERTGP
jgi:hypothetical protein